MTESWEDGRVARAVADAEAVAGLQFCVVVCDAGGPPRAQAHAALERLGLGAEPAVLVLVVPGSGTADVVLAPPVRHRLAERDVTDAVGVVEERAAAGDVVEGVVRALDRLAAAAGPEELHAPAQGPPAPDVVSARELAGESGGPDD